VPRSSLLSGGLARLAESQLGTVGSGNHYVSVMEDEGGRIWVVRKGCKPARPGREVFVGGSMGDESVILEGVAGPDADESLHSTVHGAGRVMSRTKATDRVRRRKRYACSHRHCDRVFDVDGISSSYGVPKKGICPDHPTSCVRKVWIDERISLGVVDWPAVQGRLRE
jgi:tRNA-splicing ligase RtcB